MKKVAFLTINLSQDNGWGRYSYEIIKRMPQYGIEPVVLMTSSAEVINLENVQIYSTLRSFSDGISKPIRLVVDWLTVKSILRECIIIHCLTEPLLPLASMLAMRKKHLITNAVGTYSVLVLSKHWRGIYKKAYLHARLIPAISRYTAMQVAKHLPQVEDKIRVVTLGVSTMDCSSAIPDGRSRENAFLMVGQVKPRKGTLETVKAMALVVQKFPDAKLYIVGSYSNDIYVRSVKENIRLNGIEKNVIWVGRVPNEALQDYYRRVRGLVMPSMNVGKSFEGFGLVHLEANSVGVPSIGSLGCGNEDAIRDGYSGFLIKQGDINTLAKTMIRLLNPGFDWDSMSKNALKFAQSMSWERVVEAYVSMYKEIINEV